MKLCILDADYIEEKSVIRLFCKDINGKTIVCLDYDFEPYFFVLPVRGKEREVKRRIEGITDVKVKRVEVKERNVAGDKRKVLKVFCFFSTDVQKARDVVKQWEIGRGGKLVEGEFEYSLPLYRQYLLSKGIGGTDCIEVEGKEIDSDYDVDKVLKVKSIKLAGSGSPELSLMAFDIETVEEDGEQKIVMLSIKSKGFKKVLTYQDDEHYGKYVDVLKDEKELLERFVELVNEERPDVLLGFNSDEFDMQVIQKRADKLKVRLALSTDASELKFARRARTSAARLKGLVHIDLFKFIDNILSNQMQTEMMTLDAISAELLGDKKIEMEYEEILEAWRKGKDLAKLAEYCLKDSELTFRLGEFVLPQIRELSRLSGQLLFDTSRMTFSQLVEWYLSKKAYEMDTVIPNQPKWNEIQERREFSPYEGGFVKEPIPGIHEGIAVLDFKSMYPSLMVSYNISPELLNCNCCTKDRHEIPGTKYWFCKRKRGFVSEAIRELIERRIAIREKMKTIKKGTAEWNRLDREQFAIKTVANSSYGYYAFSSSKWYCRECAQSLASLGRFFIKKVIDKAEKEGFVVLYADTDSCFVKLKDS
ncbi:MAG: DNA-directed DNA polymerase [Candidatus Aenigmatarchaeota archaeon]